MLWTSIRDAKLATQAKLLEPYTTSVPDLNDVSTLIDDSDLLSEAAKNITNMNIPELLASYSSKGLTVSEVVEAYCFRATVAHQLTNCLTEIRFEQALEEADELDKYFQLHKQLKGPLHGVVISVKDNIDVAGLATSMGFVGLAEDVKTKDSAFVELLKSLGGIILCKTNTSAGMIYSETTNVLWGRTFNPYGRHFLNVGGSSGGEGALAALKGSCFGIGSDIGGSVRHPAALNMVFSLKPSSGRFPKYGTALGQAGQESIVSVYGVMTRSLENLQHAVTTIIESSPLNIDASCIPLSFRPVTLPKKLNIGFMKSDGLTQVTPPVLRGLNIVRKALEDAGHNVFDWDDTYFKEIRAAIYPFYGADGMKHVKSILARYNEPPDPHIVNSLATATEMGVSDLWKAQTARTNLAQTYFELWNNGAGPGEKVDAVISACSAYPACLWNKVPPQPLNAVWNALDYSASTFPVTRCDVSVDVPEERTEFLSDTDREVYETYRDNLEKFDGGPVSLQVVCGKLEEEKCVELLKVICSHKEKRGKTE